MSCVPTEHSWSLTVVNIFQHLFRARTALPHPRGRCQEESRGPGQGDGVGMAAAPRLGSHIPAPWDSELKLREFIQSHQMVRTVTGNEVGNQKVARS